MAGFFAKAASHQRRWFGKWHAWAGLFAGTVLLVVSLTGSLLVYEQELDVLLNPELFAFEKQGERLSYQQVYQRVKAQHPHWNITGIYRQEKRNDAFRVNLDQGQSPHSNAIVDPYTGRVTGRRVYPHTVMGFIRDLHRTLLFPKVGEYITGVASMFMVLLLISGLRLWLPRHLRQLKSRLRIKTRAGPKRQIYDLHNTLGFYFSPFLTLIAMTGIAITFSRFVVLGLFLAGLQPPERLSSILGQKSEYRAQAPTLPIARITQKAESSIAGGKVYGITLPWDSVAAYRVHVKAPGPAKTGDHSLLYYDQYSGERLRSTHHDFTHLGKAYLNWVTPIHYGTFGGPVTRVVALLASLVVPVLFFSGLYIWWGRWKKKPKSKSHEKTLPPASRKRPSMAP